MTLPAPTYDLVLLLDPQADDATRAKLVTDTRANKAADMHNSGVTSAS